MHKYEVIIYWSNDDDTFVAEVPQLQGCAAHGNTQEEALTNINEAVGCGWKLPGNSAMQSLSPRASMSFCRDWGALNGGWLQAFRR